jgi:hypothetical protein
VTDRNDDVATTAEVPRPAADDRFDADHPDNLPAFDNYVGDLWAWRNLDPKVDPSSYDIRIAIAERYPDEVGFDPATHRLAVPVAFNEFREMYVDDRERWRQYRDEMLATAPDERTGVVEWLRQPTHHNQFECSEAWACPAHGSTQQRRPSSIVERRGSVDRDDLLRRIDLEALLDALSGDGISRGGRWRCPDRDHPDYHPSVSVTVGGDGIQRWRCWSGGHGGTAIDAVVACQRVTVGEAMRWLADRYGSWPTVDRTAPPPPRPGEPGREVVEYVQRAERLLWSPCGEPQRRWLDARGLGEDVLRQNRVGADPGRRYLPRPRGFPAGWPAVVYPALSPGGTVTYFQARYLDPPRGRDKYDNPARVHATNPRVAWLHAPGQATPGVLVVTEGVGDGLVAAQAGLPAVAVLGSQYPDARVADAIAATMDRSALLREATAVVCFDGDEAGRAGGDRLARLLDERRVRHRLVTPPEGLDLTGWAATDPGWTGRLAPAGPTLPAVSTSLQPPSAGSRLRLGLGIPGPR